MISSPAPTAPTFEAHGARVVRGGRVVLEGVDLEVRPGERVALVGPSGAGKTTLLRLLGGVLPPAAGTARFEGAELAALSPSERRRAQSRIGVVHQDLSLVPNLRVSHNVLAGRLGRDGFLASMRRTLAPRRAELEAVHALLERVGIPDKLFQRTDSLSGGEQQRVAVARALYQEPHALLADEPVAAVDPARARDVVRLLVELASEEGLALVASLHDLDLAREHFDRLVGLREGRVSFDLPAAEVSERAFRSLYHLGNGEAPDGHT
jgi:phosphonate transport system ATP-binding protein